MKLPNPGVIACAYSQKLAHQIRQEILLSGGVISFARFMELALYSPGLGYYSAGNHKLGKGGDFVTAPEISPLFAKCMAVQCKQILQELPNGNILEFGGGSGIFAKDLLSELENLQGLPDWYFILETSADLRERQYNLLAQSCPHLLERIQWLDSLPTQAMNGIILANEVMDALPVHSFRIENARVKERCVGLVSQNFAWEIIEPITSGLKEKAEILCQDYALPDGYESEINLMLPAWIRSIMPILNKGIILLSDYGYGRQEYYHPERGMGTLMCYYQHYKHYDPFTWVGLQDITAHVDFTSVIETASLENYSLAGYTTQAAFLLACGLMDIATQENIVSPKKQLQQSQEIKKLIMPTQMGELVKMMALSKKFPNPLLGFTLQDRRGCL